MSLVLRHDPAAANVQPDPAGWVVIEDLVTGAEAKGTLISRTDIERVAAASDKQRFSISANGKQIRAAQGHSIEVDLGLAPTTPPDVLWHGTAETSHSSINAIGLSPGKRRHVHLSPDPVTARNVGMRHGRPAILQVDTLKAHQGGQLFWRADNGVWLTDHLASRYLVEADTK